MGDNQPPSGSSRHEPLKGKKRKLSKFLAEEMLYDYVTGQLDQQRVTAVEEYLKTSEEVKTELEALKAGLEYCDELARTRISPDLLFKLSQERSFSSRVLRALHWNNWPEVTRWTLEALLISIFVAFVAAIGWPKFSKWIPKPSNELTLAKFEKEGKQKSTDSKNQTKEEPSAADSTNDGDGSATSTDQLAAAGDSEEDDSSKAQVGTVASTDQSPKAEVDEQKQTKEDLQAKTADVKEQTKVASQDQDEDKETERPSEASAKEKSLAANSKKKNKPRLKGSVYRIYMELEDLDEVTEEIRTEIQALGGKKAGDVRLGWRKPKGSYFHFSLFNTNYDKVVERLKTFGPVRIFKDAHWRVMPEGQIRIILWVEDKDLKEES